MKNNRICNFNLTKVIRALRQDVRRCYAIRFTFEEKLYESPQFDIATLIFSNDDGINDDNNKNQSSVSPPVNNGHRSVYIHLLLSDKQLNSIKFGDFDNDPIFVYLSCKNDKKIVNIGRIKLDISLLKSFDFLEGYYHIYDYNDANQVLGQIHINVRPQSPINICAKHSSLFSTASTRRSKSKSRLLTTGSSSSNSSSIESERPWKILSRLTSQMT